MYLVAIVKGLMITIKHLFTRKVTIQYPEEVRERVRFTVVNTYVETR
jgi:NADH-quinone oxidoreductase subunit I